METKLVTVQPAVGGMIKASKDSFVIPKEELKDFYLKIRFPPEPGFLLRKPHRIRTIKHSAERPEKNLGSIDSPQHPSLG